MRTPLEISTQLNELLTRSKPFRNSSEIFSLVSELISSLTPTEILPQEEIVENIPEKKPVKKKPTKKK